MAPALQLALLLSIWASSAWIRTTEGRIRSVDSRNASDVALIEYEIKNLNRPELLLDNSVLVQEVDSAREVTEYRWITIRRDDRDGDVDRAEKSHIVLTRPGIEVGQNNIIFNSGEHKGFGPKTKRAYVVLRKYEKVRHPHTYLVNLVYIWNIGTRQEIHIEWCSFDEVDYLVLNTDNKIERALCRDDDCDFPQWIFGTCELVSQDCSSVLAAGLRTGGDFTIRDYVKNFQRRLQKRRRGRARGDSDDESDDNNSSDDNEDEDDILGGRVRGRERGSSDWRSKVRKYWQNSERGRNGRRRASWDSRSRWGSPDDHDDSDESAQSEESAPPPRLSLSKPGLRIRVPFDGSSEKYDSIDDVDESNESKPSKKRSKSKRSSKEREWWSQRKSRGRGEERNRKLMHYEVRPKSKGPANYYKYLEQKLENDANDTPMPDALNIGDQRLQTHLDAPGPETDTPMHWEPDGHVLRQRRSASADPGNGMPSNYYKLLEQIRDRQKQAAQGLHGFAPPSMDPNNAGGPPQSQPPPSLTRRSDPRHFAITIPPDLTAAAMAQQQRMQDMMMVKAIADAKRGMSSITSPPGIADSFVGGGGSGGNGTTNTSTTSNSTNSTNSTKPIPTSFDLLLIDRVSLPNGSTELGFKSQVVDKARDTLDAELKQICYDCASIGNFYDDFLEEAKYSRRIGRILKRQHRKRPNRKLYKYPTSNSTSRNASNANAGAAPETVAPFVGFGDCGSRKLPAVTRSPRHPKSAQLDDVIEFYVEVLRVQCKEDLQTQLRSWLTSKLNFTHVQADLSLGLMPSSLIMKYNLLSKEEYEILFSAAIFSQFTMRFVEETNLGLLATDNRVVLPPKTQIMQLSPQTGFLKRLVLRFLTYIQYQIPQHYVKFTRSLIQLLQDKFFTLLSERIRLIKAFRRMSPQSRLAPVRRSEAETRAEVSNEILLNYNDLQQIMGLKEYIIFGIEPSLKSGVPNRETYASFYALNAKRMKYLVDSYHIY